MKRIISVVMQTEERKNNWTFHYMAALLFIVALCFISPGISAGRGCNIFLPLQNDFSQTTAGKSEKQVSMNEIFRIKARCISIRPTNKHMSGYYFFFEAKKGNDPDLVDIRHFILEEKVSPAASLLMEILKVREDSITVTDDRYIPDSTVIVELGFTQGYGPDVYHLISFSYGDTSYSRFHFEGRCGYAMLQEEKGEKNAPVYKFYYQISKINFGDHDGQVVEFTASGNVADQLLKDSKKGPYQGKTGNDHFRPAPLVKLYAEIIVIGNRKHVTAWAL